MAKTVTLADLLADIRALYEIRSTSLSDTILARWVNQALALLYDHLISVAPDYFISSYDLAVSSGTSAYSLTSLIPTFYKGHGADVLLETGRYSPLRSFQWEERHLLSNTVTSRGDQLYRYMGTNLHLAPTPGWSGTMRVWFIPTATVLVGGATPNTFDCINSWDEFIVAEAALKCAIKEEAPTRDLLQRRNMLLEEIKSFAPQRDLSHFDRVRDASAQIRAIADPFARLPQP